MGACRAYQLVVSFMLLLSKATAQENANNDPSSYYHKQLTCDKYDEEGCSVYRHINHSPEHTIPLKRHVLHGKHSVLQMAVRNHELFRNGKVSYAKRGEGVFGSIGYNKGHHGDKGSSHIHDKRYVNLRTPKKSDIEKYIPIHGTKDSLYVGEIRVGSPPQVVRPIFDTGSTNLWVVGESCKDPSCLRVAKYNPRRSSTFRLLQNPLKIHVKFGTGEIEGYAAQDTISIGDIHIPRQNFAVVESEQPGGSEENIFDKINFEGIVGLAFPEMSSVPGVPVFDNIAILKNMKHKEFAFYIGESDEESKLMFGGVDPDCYEGEIKLFPVVREHYWEVKLDAVYVGSEKICSDEDNQYLIFDSGTSLNTIPSDYFDRFMSYFKNKICNGDFEDYPTITYVINGVKIKLEPHQYMMKYKDTCTPAYMQLDVPSEFGNAFIVGSNAFMKHYVTVFRRGDGRQPSMVGIAPSKHT
ncbi:aspartic peptidase A1 family protein [Babesia gibsoni]|uniref:Aspartic peptidase A1 family protein n=1 Tax=Babesia gibsoni TaxID=33632 RepID=A0AAD8LJG9_BABGI|nr:aspartic peptidase A1 family protein [Babesia gibsoni]